MKIRAALWLAATCLTAFATCAAAEPITFVYTGTGTGSLNGNPFSDAAFTITGHGDTAARFDDGGAGVYWIDHTAADIAIAGLGDFTFITPTRTFVNNNVDLAGFSRTGLDGSDLYYAPPDPVLEGWNMLSSVGPIAGTGQIVQWDAAFNDPVLTSGGQLLMESGTPAATFQATVGVAAIPEPETYAMFLAGIGFLGFIARRRRGYRSTLTA